MMILLILQHETEPIIDLKITDLFQNIYCDDDILIEVIQMVIHILILTMMATLTMSIQIVPNLVECSIPLPAHILPP